MLTSDQIVILEAMKLEIAVRTPDSAVKALKDGKLKAEKLLAKPGDTIQAGGHIVLLRKV
jgi:biotin carboxyl carrier protein